MTAPLERVTRLIAELRLLPVDLDTLYRGQNSLSPLESLEVFLTEEQRLRTERQNQLRRRKANLPIEKTLDTFDFGFQRSVSKEQMLRLSDMTWVEQAYNICFLGPPGVGKTHLALSLAVQGLDYGYAVAFETLESLMKHLKIAEISKSSQHRLKYLGKCSLIVLVKQNCNTSVTFLSDLRRRKPIVCCVRSLIVVPTICISGYFRI